VFYLFQNFIFEVRYSASSEITRVLHLAKVESELNVKKTNEA